MTEVKESIINRSVIENAFTYSEYREMIDQLLMKGKTTGENHSETMIHYTNMNTHRMNRLDKRVKVDDALLARLEKVQRSMTWLILTEAWCGDAAQVLPAIQKIAEHTPKIQTRYILRDENLEIMDRFLTDGRSRSIPMVICLDSQTLEVLGTWGPRPTGARTLHRELTQQEMLNQEVAEKIHKWYADDKTSSVQNEILHLLDEWE